MAQKFANFRWVKEGYFDDRMAGLVIGQVTFAGLGPVDFCLKGQFTGEIAGKVIQFKNSKYIDDARAADALAEFEIPQIGSVSLMSFDPHPLLPPHPYFEWFSKFDDHFRFELEPEDAHILSDEEVEAVAKQSQTIHEKLSPLLG